MNATAEAFSFDEGDARVLALAVTTLASMLTEAEENAERKGRKAKVLDLKLDALARVGMDVVGPPKTDLLCNRLTELVREWTTMKRNALLIDVAFADPFAPYDLEVSSRVHAEQLGLLCPALGLDPKRGEQVLESIKEARKAHRHIAWGKIAVGTVLGAVVLAAGGYFAAPLIAAELGGAAGLSGAAAVSHGLALLGGGSLAAGGGGIAGGMALVTSLGATIGGVGAGGGAALWSAGYAAALGELVKLQVSYKEILLRAQLRSGEAARVVDELHRQLKQLRAKLAEERELNDRKSKRIQDLELIERGYDDTIKWLGNQHREAP